MKRNTPYFNMRVYIYISEKIKYILKYGPKNFGTHHPLLPFGHAVRFKRNRTNLRGQWLLYVCARSTCLEFKTKLLFATEHRPTVSHHPQNKKLTS